MKIIIIGKNGFVASNLRIFLKKKKVTVRYFTFKKFLKQKENFIKNHNYVINCTSNYNFVNKNYLLKNDFDTIIAKFIENTNVPLIILSTRKVYKSRENINENGKLLPKCNYSKNKLIAEKNCEKILNNNLLILRVGNLIGEPLKNKKKLHNTFVDIFFNFVKKGIIYENKKSFKDFLPVKKFCEIIFKLMKIQARGIFNVSLGKKVYLNDMVKWLNFYNKKKIAKFSSNNSFKKDNFTLNNKKLKNEIKIKINLSELKKECIKLSKKMF